MRYLILFLLSLQLLLGSNVATTENEPASLIEGIVSAVTGDLYTVEEDIVVQGAVPLRFQRVYLSSTNKWTFFEHLMARHFLGTPLLAINEPNGTPFVYRYKDDCFRLITTDGLTNTARGELSALTNPKNQHAIAKKDELILFTSNGSTRIYKKSLFQTYKDQADPVFYLLQKEVFLNKNQIIYTWDDESKLVAICTMGPNEEVYASAKVHHHGKRKKHHGHFYSTNQDFDILTSDGRRLEYTYFYEGKHHKKRWFLRRVTSSDDPPEEFHYRENTEKRPIDTIFLPDNRSLQITYNRDNKVSSLITPAGTTTIEYFSNKTTAYDPMGFPTHYYYDDTLRLTKIETPYNTTTFTWEDSNLKSKSLVGVYTVNYTYDTAGNIIEETFTSDLGTATKQFQYNDKNLLVYKKEANGLITTYDYENNLLIAEHTLDKHTFYEYENGILILETHIHGPVKTTKKIIPVRDGPFRGMPEIIEEPFQKTELTYTTGGRISQKKALDYTLSYKYDHKGRLIEETNALGQIALHDYDTIGNKTFFKNFGAEKPLHMSYDSCNRLTLSMQDDRTIKHSYDKKGNRISTIDRYGYETRYVYDARGLILETHTPHGSTYATYDAMGNKNSHTDANGYTTYTTYTAYGNPSHIHYPDDTHEYFHYSADGTLLSSTNQNGIKTFYTYDLFGRCISKKTDVAEELWTYDGPNLIKYTNANGHSTTYAYDAFGRKIYQSPNEEYTYDHKNRLRTLQEGDLVTTYEYDLLDRVIKETKHDLVTLYTYDAAGNKASITKGESQELFFYDPFDRLIRKIDPLGHVTTITYNDDHTKITTDPLGLQTKESYNSQYLLTKLEKGPRTETYIYDSEGNLLQKDHIHFTYDALNRLTTLIESDKITRYSYTPTGKVATLTKPSGVTITNTYDPLDHLTSKTSSDGTIHYTYLYDTLGNLLQSTDGVHTITRTYDHKNRLLTESIDDLLFQNNYDSSGRRTTFTLPDKSHIDYTYDPLYLRKVSRNGYTHSYTDYDSRGNLIQEESLLGPITHTYNLKNNPLKTSSPHFTHEILAYDHAGNVLKDSSTTYTYDALYQLTSDHAHTYTYDSNYNRKTKDSVSYHINSLNQLSDFTYDPNGNPIIIDDTHYTYDALDRLIKVETPTHTQIYTYDSLHRCLTKNNDRFLYDNQNEIGLLGKELRILGRTPNAEISSAVAFELACDLFVPFYDLYGNVSKIMTINEEIFDDYTYTAFGESHPSGYSPWRFSSKRQDPITNLIYFGRRYYLPTHGRFLTPDPLGYSASSNLYAFVSNSPLTHLDLYGLYESPHWKNFPPERTNYPTNYQHYINDTSVAFGAFHGAHQFASSFAYTTAYFLTLPRQTADWAFGHPSPLQNWRTFQDHAHIPFKEPAPLSSDLIRQSSLLAHTYLDTSLLLYNTPALTRSLFKGAEYSLQSLSKHLSHTPKNLARTSRSSQESIIKNVKKFPNNPNQLLPTLPRDSKGHIYTSDFLRIRPEQHSLKNGETFCPRHHGQHFHVEGRFDPSKSWNNKNNTYSIKPPNYTPGQGTGFLPGELFPGLLE